MDKLALDLHMHSCLSPTGCATQRGPRRFEFLGGENPPCGKAAFGGACIRLRRGSAARTWAAGRICVG